jgi:hypothetical protein
MMMMLGKLLCLPLVLAQLVTPYTPLLLTPNAAEAKNGTTHRSGAPQFNRSLSDVSPVKRTPYTLQQESLLYDRVLDFSMQLAAEPTSAGGLSLGVNPGYYRKADGSIVYFAGEDSLTLDDDTTALKVWIDVGTNTLDQGASYPGTPTAYFPLLQCDTADGEIIKSSIVDQRTCVAHWIPPAAAAINGTDDTEFTIDQDNAGSPVDMSLVFNRGSSPDAMLTWVEADEVFQFSIDGSGTAAIDVSDLYISGYPYISGGYLTGGSINPGGIYTFGPNGNVGGVGLQFTPTAFSGPPSGGTHAAGETCLDQNHVLWLNTAAGTPGTWKRVGDLSSTRNYTVDVPDSSGASPRDVTIQVRDAAGNAVSEVVYLQVGVYADADGADVDSSATIAVVTNGTDLAAGQHEGAAEATKVRIVKTNASGQVTIRVTRGSNGTVYLLTAPAPRSPRLDCVDIGTVTIS